ncbi:hypothetical protein OUZ56_023728 [Daphnia magna]|uniref:Uncharacterized protein n=1 Tax=Daphnia magna TaxID=35525 RepID=A0ABR0AZD1_9CRUS|nr:hypothetical protein OUZ56_023728 [Daphnia magna]
MPKRWADWARAATNRGKQGPCRILNLKESFKMAEISENPIGQALLDCLESGLDDLFEKTTLDGRASEIVELVAVGYNENGSVLFDIDTNEELKEDSSKIRLLLWAPL